MKNKLHIIGLFLFIILALFSPKASIDVGYEKTIYIEDSPKITSGYVPRGIRVAIYDEPNMTAPDYATYPGNTNNNATGLRDILEAYGFQVTLLDVRNISEHQLKTAAFDVLVLVDNFPRENITYSIMDFWLGGGGILALDGSAAFLCSFGILPPEAIDTDGHIDYWNYNSQDINITNLHPSAKQYSINQTITTVWGYLAWNWTALQETSIADDLTMVARSNYRPDFASVLAFDPSNRGGKVVTIALDLVHDNSPDLEPLYADAVDWLAPRPKARILFDLSHVPWVPCDPWEDSPNTVYFTPWRDGLVSRLYTIDKLHPSAQGNFTAENLASYDMLVTNQPGLNFTPQEIQVVEQWVQGGGSLFVIGDNAGVPDNYRLNELISPYGIQFNHTTPSFYGTFSNYNMHPTTEHCSTLEYAGAATLNLTGDAYPIWNYTESDIAVGASEYGAGRVVVIPDANSLLDSWIVLEDNEQFLMNIANWLTTSGTSVLVYHDSTGIPSYNHYRSAIAQALNDLGLDFMLTFKPDYFNLSLNSQEWDLIISDANSFSPLPLHPFLKEHLDNGGKLIMRDFSFYESQPFWHYLGFEGRGSSERITDGAPTVYMWDIYHDVFDRPVEYGEDYIESTADYYVTDWTSVMLFDNASAIAGITPTREDNQSAIVLSVEGRALCNMFSISQYYDDFDNSTYADNYELWLNEIAYMMRPTIDSPGDLVFECQGAISEFAWTAHSYAPGDYQIKRNGGIITTRIWDGSPIIVDISSLSVGVYEYKLMVRDHVGYRADDTIYITIEDNMAPTWDPEPSDKIVELGDDLNYDLNATDPSSLDTWWLNDTNFVISNEGVIHFAGVPSVGTFILLVSVNDTSGNTLTGTFTVTVEDTTAPAWNPEPTNQEVEYGSLFRYDLNATDLSAIDYWAVNDTRFTIDSNGIMTNATVLSLGDYWLKVEVHDQYDNIKDYSFKVSIVDTTPPVFVATPSDVEVEEGDTVILTWNASDLCPSSYSIFLDGELLTADEWNTSMPIIVVVLVDLEPGEYNITIVIEDCGGNTAADTVGVTVTELVITTTTTTSTTISTTPSEPSIIDSTIIIIMVAAGAMLIIIIIFIMRKRSG